MGTACSSFQFPFSLFLSLPSPLLLGSTSLQRDIALNSRLIRAGNGFSRRSIEEDRSFFSFVCLFLFFFVYCYCDAARLKTKVFEGKFLFELEFRGNWLEMLFSYFFFIVIPSEKVCMALIWILIRFYFLKHRFLKIEANTKWCDLTSITRNWATDTFVFWLLKLALPYILKLNIYFNQIPPIWIKKSISFNLSPNSNRGKNSTKR